MGAGQLTTSEEYCHKLCGQVQTPFWEAEQETARDTWGY